MLKKNGFSPLSVTNSLYKSLKFSITPIGSNLFVALNENLEIRFLMFFFFLIIPTFLFRLIWLYSNSYFNLNIKYIYNNINIKLIFNLLKIKPFFFFFFFIGINWTLYLLLRLLWIDSNIWIVEEYISGRSRRLINNILFAYFQTFT